MFCETCGERGAGCAGCEYAAAPELMDANRDAWRLWLASRTQWRAGGLGVIGLDYPAVEWVGARLTPPVAVDGRMLTKLQALEAFELERRAGTGGADAGEQG